jgi:Flp pilus assembly protein TadD
MINRRHRLPTGSALAAAGNASWQSDLGTAYSNVGGVQQAQGDLAGALKSYRDALAIVERLAKSDPSNASWQSDLGTAYANLASAFGKGNDNAKAL